MLVLRNIHKNSIILYVTYVTTTKIKTRTTRVERIRFTGKKALAM